MSNRHPYLHKRGNRYHFFWKDKSGKRHEEALRTADLQIAVKRYQERMEEIKAGCLPNDRSDWTLQQAAHEWLERRQFQIAKGSYHSEHTILRNLLRELGSNSNLRSLADVEEVRVYQHKRRKAGASPKTINNEMQVMRGILETAQLWQRVERDYRPLRWKKSDVPDALTHEESIRLLRCAADSSPASVAPAAAVLAFSTGLRSGEIKRLKFGDLHHRDAFPHLIVRRENTKTDAGARRVALDQTAVWAVERLSARARLIGSMRPADYLLPTDLARHTRHTDPLHGGSGFDPRHPQSSWEWEWNELRNAAGIGHRRFHDLRHSYITRAAEAGIPPAVLKAQVGHVSNEMLSWYTHISTRAQHEAASRIEAESPELLRALGIPTVAAVANDSRNRALSLSGPPRRVESAAFSNASSPRPVILRHCRLRSRCRQAANRIRHTTTYILAIELEQLQQNPSEGETRVARLREETNEISNDVEALSHELHSSKLQYLGVVAGIRSWCREFGERQNIEIDFRTDVATVLPFEIGVCLFRVLQEALHNIIKHSGVKRVEVRLMEQSNQVHLIVSDSGKGFHVESAKQGKGLGLTSMGERVRLVNGTIAIESKPMGGTTIEVRVPLGTETFSKRIAG